MQRRYILITGGAGFIGTNIARSYLEEDQPVHIFDNLSRPGVEENITALHEQYPGNLHFTQADIRDPREVEKAVSTAGTIYHLAAQVAVTTSLEEPLQDVATNLMGTLHVLEAIRKAPSKPSLLFTSTNKVYGRLASVPLRKGRRSGMTPLILLSREPVRAKISRWNFFLHTDVPREARISTSWTTRDLSAFAQRSFE